jgi:hypothetical protein
MNLTSHLHRYFAALDVENRLCRCAAGREPFPPALQSLSFARTELGLRTGYTDRFTARLAGLEGDVALSLPADIVRQLAGKMAQASAAVAAGLAAARAAHAAPEGPAPVLP